MRKISGWLCYASLVLTVAFAAYFSYLTLAPFFRGGELRYYWDYSQERNSSMNALVKQLACEGINSPNLLRGYVLQNVGGLNGNYNSHYSWETIDQFVDTWTTPKVSDGRIQKTWAAVADRDGIVIATYPKEYRKPMGLVNRPTVEGWRGALASGQNPTDEIDVASVFDAHGKQIGSVAVAWRQLPQGKVAVIPPEAQVHGIMPQFSAALAAIISLLAFIVLLPTWVAFDASWRGMRSFAWVALIILTGPIGLAAYLIARLAPPRLCPNCGEEVFSKYKKCPVCGTPLHTKCPICGKKLKPGWQYCPTCTEQQSKQQTEPCGEQSQPEEPVTIHQDFDALQEGPAMPELCEPYQNIEVNGSISGRVIDKLSFQPITGARVFIDSTRVERETETDSSGEFRLEAIPEGPYSLCADAPGYACQTKIADVEPGQCLTIGFALETVIQEDSDEAQ